MKDKVLILLNKFGLEIECPTADHNLIKYTFIEEITFHARPLPC